VAYSVCTAHAGREGQTAYDLQVSPMTRTRGLKGWKPRFQGLIECRPKEKGKMHAFSSSYDGETEVSLVCGYIKH
jgi:hypothetical protein